MKVQVMQSLVSYKFIKDYNMRSTSGDIKRQKRRTSLISISGEPSRFNRAKKSILIQNSADV